MLKSMTLHLTIHKNKNHITVDCSINFDAAVTEISFYLNELLTVKSRRKHVTKKETLELRSPVTFHHIALNSPSKKVTIHYSGAINGWMNTLEDDFISLNLYSAWFPILVDHDLKPVKKTVYINGIDDFDIVNGVDHESQKIIKDNSFDCIIFAGKGMTVQTIEYNTITLTILNPTTNNFVPELKSVLDFYHNELGLPIKLTKTLNIVINPYSTGGFNREQFIVLSSLPDNKFDLLRFIAHEIGHFWATGADPTSFEDWLNESFAELLSLLYLDKHFSVGKTKQYKNKLQQSAIEQPNVITSDGSRPKGVHVKGVSIFIEYWDHFGKESIIELVHKFLMLQEKTTSNFLDALSDDSREFIEKKL